MKKDKFNLKKIILINIFFITIFIIFNLILSFFGLRLTNLAIKIFIWFLFIDIAILLFFLLLKINNKILKIVLIFLYINLIFFLFGMSFYISTFYFGSQFVVINNKKFILEEDGFLFDTDNKYYDYINYFIQYKQVKITENYIDKDEFKTVVFYDKQGNIIKKVEIPTYDDINIIDFLDE